jgi:hypothetical protein
MSQFENTFEKDFSLYIYIYMISKIGTNQSHKNRSNQSRVIFTSKLTAKSGSTVT